MSEHTPLRESWVDLETSLWSTDMTTEVSKADDFWINTSVVEHEDWPDGVVCIDFKGDGKVFSLPLTLPHARDLLGRLGRTLERDVARSLEGGR